MNTKILSLLALAVGLAVPVSSQAIQLRNGDTLVGEVVDATTEGLSFRRLDNGGLLVLRWEDLSSLHATRIKRLEGLLIEDQSEVTVEADVITFTAPGGTTEEVVGLIDQWTKTHVMLKRRSGILPIAHSTITKQRKKEVPALEVYSAEEWYQLQLTKANPGDDPDKHVLLSDEMLRIGNYERAEEHLRRAQELGGGKHSAQLASMLQQIQRLAKFAAERDLLSQIRIMRNRGQFEKAAELITQFRETYPGSELEAELRREEQRWESERDRHLFEELRQGWDRTVRRLAYAVARDEKSSIAQARSYAEDRMADDVYADLAKALEVGVDKVKAIWAGRLQFGIVRPTIHSYGIGSWVLGEEAILEGTKNADTGGEDDAEVSAEDRELERLIRKLQEVQRRGKQMAAQGGADEEVTEEDWWKDASSDDRMLWLRAYFAERGGQMEVVRAYARPCGTCEGLGYMVELGVNGQKAKRNCPLCHETKFTRTVRAR